MKKGFLYPDEERDRIRKFNELKEEHPGLFKTCDPTKSMPVHSDVIWKAWGPSVRYYQATVLDVEIQASENSSEQLIYTLCFETDDAGNRLEPGSCEKHVGEYHLDYDMNEWSYQDSDQRSKKRSRS